jgi:hypothetical protein
VLDITDSDVYDALCSFVSMIVPEGTPIQRGQINGVPMPSVDCVILTTIGAPDRIGTNLDTTEAVIVDGVIVGFTAAVEADFKYSVQADFYSQYAESWAMSAELLWRDKIGYAAMPAGIKPLYSEGRQQLPIIGAENQWIQRWTMNLFLDYQPTWTQPTQAALTANVIPEPIDVFFPSTWTSDSDNVTADSDSSN